MKTRSLWGYNPQRKKSQIALCLSLCMACSLPVNAISRASNLSAKKSNVPITSSVQGLEHNSVYQQQKITIKGVVKDTNGEAIIGASVKEKGTNNVTVTDVDGKFSISISNKELQISFIGYQTQIINVKGSVSSYNIVLQEDAKTLEEVVVVGYGSQKKESVIGAISTIDATKLKVPGASISTVLAGQLAGIVAVTRSGEPGKDGSAEFYIRGVSSFKGNSKPLVLVDGIERELDLVDTDDIEKFSILKDASASAVYGVRGANGVILITTKKGSEGKPKINVRSEAGITMPTKMPEFVNSAQWAELYNMASGKEYYSPEVIQKYKDGSDKDLYPNVNWIDELYKNFASNQRINLSLTGGNKITKYYVSGSIYHEGSIFKNENRYDYNSSISYRKYNFRANVDFSLTESTVLNVNLANIYEKSFGPGTSKGDIWGYTFNTSPNGFPKEYSDGTISAPSSASGYNPWNLLVHSGYREQFWNSSQSLIGLTQDLGKLVTPGLSANIKFS